MIELTHSVLGTPYKVLLGNKSAIGLNEENLGACKVYAKEILVHIGQDDCTDEELRLRTEEVIIHEVFHAYANEVGLDIDEDTEEMIANFLMKNWRKMNNSILEICDESGFLDK